MNEIEINGATRIVGVIGWPVQHSLSPHMHNAAFRALGLNWKYIPLPVQPSCLEAAVAGLQALGFAGANITIPHKETIIAYLDELSPAARAIGAVNTIVIREGRVVGDNTDVMGFLTALDRAGVLLEERIALVIGAGGAARAACFGLLSRQARVKLLARTTERARRLAEDMRHSVPSGSIEVIQELPVSVDLVVNCTPVGMWPHDGESPLPPDLDLRKVGAVMDMVYRPLETKMLKQAGAAGALTISGLEMLVYQGAAAFEQWTGIPAPVDVMRKACLPALNALES